VKLGVALGWHVHPWEELLALVRAAEELGYTAAFVDGDVSMLAERAEADALDGWTVTTALLAHTRRIQIGSMRIAHHWHAARLAQAAATAERLAPGRLRFLVSAGDQPIDARFGLPVPPAGERIERLDETLGALRRLWRGETVSLDGRFLRLDRARVRPVPPQGRIRIEIAAKGPRMLGLVARHADVWEVNLPPSPPRVAEAARVLAGHCRAQGREPDTIERSMWLFTRLAEAHDAGASLKEYRRLNPWFRWIPDGELAEAMVLGTASRCRERLAELAAGLRLDWPVVDLSGLAAEPSLRVMEALAPAAASR
jgi:alkanesulfonate monooxygenase SsuD/methylene tetrahydromethanopterin reductase-like flavin-dependent oxidoreductase (luciferase family)